MDETLFSFLIIISSLAEKINSQQSYTGDSALNCFAPNGTTPSADFLYMCNGKKRSCQSFLVFRSQSPYNSVPSISNLTSSPLTKLASMNNVSETETFPNNSPVIIPVKCSCWKQYYQANSSYVIQPQDTYYTIATTIYQGLSTCSILQQENDYHAHELEIGAKLLVPLRCACPNKKQILEGTKFLLTYLVTYDDTVVDVCKRFGVSTSSVVYANGFLDENESITPMTTILIPLSTPPLSNQTKQTLAPPPPPPPTSQATSPIKYVLIGSLGGGFFVFLISIIVFCILFRKNKKKPELSNVTEFETIEIQSHKEEEENEIDTKELLDSILAITQSSLKVYKFDELIPATNNFSPECWIKGSVYRGNFKGDYAAIKEVDGDVSDEIKLLNTISHSNLIRLSGVCFNEGHWYLIYEYASNGSLSDWVYNNNSGGKFLSWTQRMQIGLDVAMGLNYIHNYASPPYVHKDVTSNNILLDNHLRAKVANFGLARSAEKGEPAFTRHIVGTQGYMAPEYLENGLISTKLDVFAFGVLMLELITGKEAVVLHKGINKPLSDILSDLFDEINGNENLSKFMDSSMEGNYPTDLIVFVARLVENCIKRDQSSRPGMNEIVQSLSKIVNSSLDWERSNNNSGYQSFN